MTAKKNYLTKLAILTLVGASLFHASAVKGFAEQACAADPTHHRQITAPVLNYNEENGTKAIPGVVNRITYNLPGITTRNKWALPSLTLSVGGKRLSEKAVIMNGIVYVPLKESAEAIGKSTLTYDKTGKLATLTMDGLVLSASDGGFVVYANGRPLFGFSPSVVMSDGNMYVNAQAFAKAVGMTFTKTDSAATLKGSFRPLLSADKFYREDEVLWLSRIIQAESGGEPLIGQIAVGNVIMNRVKSPLYPNTIWGVIFDKRYGVQFSPISNGTIYNTPSYNATLAAKIILEGTRLSDDVLFFLNPIYSQSGWIVENRTYAYSIGGHDFYK